MSNARLLSLTLERFKSYEQATEIPFSPLTIVLGRNNSGKSTIIQALLLLKQTLALPRPEVPLHVQGALFEALHLREITSGWPTVGAEVPGPRIGLRWSSRVNLLDTWHNAGHSNPETTARITEGKLFSGSWKRPRNIETELVLDYAELNERTVLREIRLAAYTGTPGQQPELQFIFKRGNDGGYTCSFGEHQAAKIQVELDHFIPYLTLSRGKAGPRDRQRSWYMAFALAFAEPLEDLKALLGRFAYLASTQTPPRTLYNPVPVPPEDIGVNAEDAARMLYARRGDHVHYPPPLQIDGDDIKVPTVVRSRSLVDAVNDVLRELGVDAPLRIDDLKDMGFRLLFGQASVQQVGRGLSYLMPVIQLGLIADPLRFVPGLKDVRLSKYEKKCQGITHCALEEPEKHLHPKVQSRLAHWFVALAMARRQILVETHSDHLVRRLRGLVARAKPGSDLERWLLENVRVLKVEQVNSRSVVTSSLLTAQGSLEDWPADFMDEATDEERAIYYAGMDKRELTEEIPYGSGTEFVEGREDDEEGEEG